MLSFFFEFGLIGAADGACPVRGEVFKFCSRLDVPIGVSLFRIIGIAAHGAGVFC